MFEKKTGRSDTGLLHLTLSKLPFVSIEITRAILNLSGNIPEIKE